MRTPEEIEAELMDTSRAPSGLQVKSTTFLALAVELLLDIREILQHPPVQTLEGDTLYKPCLQGVCRREDCPRTAVHPEHDADDIDHGKA